MQFNEKWRNLTPSVTQTPKSMATNFGMGDEVGDPYNAIQ